MRGQAGRPHYLTFGRHTRLQRQVAKVKQTGEGDRYGIFRWVTELTRQWQVVQASGEKVSLLP